MGFRMSCDRCGRFLKNVKLIDLKKINNIEEIICPQCTAVEEKVRKDLNRLKIVAEGEFKKLIDLYRDTITEIVQKRLDDGDS